MLIHIDARSKKVAGYTTKYFASQSFFLQSLKMACLRESWIHFTHHLSCLVSRFRLGSWSEDPPSPQPCAQLAHDHRYQGATTVGAAPESFHF